MRPDAIKADVVYSRATLAAAVGVTVKTIDRWSKQPSDELPAPFYQKRSPYWLGSELLTFFARKQRAAVEAVAI